MLAVAVPAKAGVDAMPSAKHPRMAADKVVFKAYEYFMEKAPGRT
jgi:hypothetical protein